MGNIYIIRNKLNNKVYIGQTQLPINTRFMAHKYCAKNNKYGSKDKLHRAMSELGIDNFYIELLETTCENLTNREAQYINKFKSIENGYNVTYPNSRYNTNIDRISNIVNDYIHGMTIVDIAVKYNTSNTKIVGIVSDINIDRDITINYTNKAKKCVVYSLDFDPIFQFKSISDALKWVHTQKYFTYDKRSTYQRINIAFKTGAEVFGYRWQLLEDLIYKDMVFRTIFDKNKYLSGCEAYKPDGKLYYIVDGSLNDILNKNKRADKNRCKICNKIIYRSSKLCRSCYEEEIRRKSNKPDKEILSQLLVSETYSSIGRLYGVTSNCVKKWCNSYGITRYGITESQIK